MSNDSMDGFFEDDIFTDGLELGRAVVCDNCLTDGGHCPGQLECEKYLNWLDPKGKRNELFDESQYEIGTIGMHLASHES